MLEIKIPAKVGEADKLFGSVTNIDLAAALDKEGDSIDLVYEDEVRTTQENAVLSTTLGAEFYNGTIRIANETLTNTPQRA